MDSAKYAGSSQGIKTRVTYHDTLTKLPFPNTLCFVPNQRDLARKLGLTQATISRALRGDHSIAAGTREKIARAAEDLGYKANPLVSALMTQVRSNRKVSEQGCIAVVVDAKSKSDWLVSEAYELQFEGFARRAALRGYSVECFFLHAEGSCDKAIDKILYSRGILGIILAAPMRRDSTSLMLTWKRYAPVTIGYNWNFLVIDRVSSNHLHNVEIAFNELRKRGYERIGFSLPEGGINPAGNPWLAGFLAKEYHLPKSRRLPIFVGSPKTTPLEKFRCWYEKWRPDALLCLLGEELQWMRQLGLSPLKDLAVVCLNRPLGSRFSGLEENNILVGEVACDVVVNHIVHNERGLPTQPKFILVEGTWVEGKTLPARKP